MSRIPLARPLGPWPRARNGAVKVPIRDHGQVVWTTVSVQDYGLVMARRWHIDSSGYARAIVPGGIPIWLHRLVARAPSGVLVDHRFGNLLDNRRSMLRWATPSENSANRRRDRRGRSSRFRGVTLHKQTGRWQAAIKHHNRCRYLGLFRDEMEAARAYNAAALEVWGAFAILNRLPASEAQAA